MTDTDPLADESATVEAGVTVGAGTRIWHLAHLRAGVRVGRDCTVGRGVYLGPGVRVGDRCKIQNHALLYEPAMLEDGCFVGPGVVFTNDSFPRAVTPSGLPKGSADWTPVGVTVRTGASVGARAVCIAPVTIGRWAMVAAGAVVTRDVADHALVVGVPARRVGWVGRAGLPLHPLDAGLWCCPATGELYREAAGALLDEAESR